MPEWMWTMNLIAKATIQSKKGIKMGFIQMPGTVGGKQSLIHFGDSGRKQKHLGPQDYSVLRGRKLHLNKFIL